jgi:hypothetical protein
LQFFSRLNLLPSYIYMCLNDSIRLMSSVLRQQKAPLKGQFVAGGATNLILA